MIIMDLSNLKKKKNSFTFFNARMDASQNSVLLGGNLNCYLFALHFLQFKKQLT